MKLLKKEWLQLLILAAPFCVAALLWNKLPERMAIHWDAAGHVNGYAGRAFGSLFAPCVNIGTALLLGCIPLIDPKVQKYDAPARENIWRVIRIMRLGITAFTSIICLAVIAIAVHLPVNMMLLINWGMAALFILIGNYLTKVRPNFFVGIRTPWTLESPEVWTKTHRLGGRLLVGSSIVLLLLSLVVPSQQFFRLFVPIEIGMLLIPAVYSYFCYKQLKNT